MDIVTRIAHLINSIWTIIVDNAGASAILYVILCIALWMAFELTEEN